MAYTKEQLDELKEAYASGVLEVRVNNEKLTYKSNKEMLEAIRIIENELGISRKRKPKSIYPRFGKGL